MTASDPRGARALDLYLDYNGSTPIHPKVLEASRPFLEGAFANPSAAHPAGRAVSAAIAEARAVVAEALGASDDEIVFTSGGSEANNQALLGSVPRGRRSHVVVSTIEHKSVLAAAEELERRGCDVTRLPVDTAGAVRLRDVEAALRPETALVSVMCANNETGIVQPVAGIGALCRSRGILFHTDAVCMLGKLPVDVRAIGCDLLSLSAHKLYAPKGCGVLYVRRDVEVRPLIFGCGQQHGLRSGTENAFASVAFARALELMQRGALGPARPIEDLRDELWRGIQERFPLAERNGQGASLSNTLSVSFPGCNGAELQAALAQRGISVSAGSAALGAEPSHVLLAMGHGLERSRGSVRFSLGSGTSAETIRCVLSALEEALSGPARALVAPSRGGSRS